MAIDGHSMNPIMRHAIWLPKDTVDKQWQATCDKLQFGENINSECNPDVLIIRWLLPHPLSVLTNTLLYHMSSTNKVMWNSLNCTENYFSHKDNMSDWNVSTAVNQFGHAFSHSHGMLWKATICRDTSRCCQTKSERQNDQLRLLIKLKLALYMPYALSPLY